MCAQLGQLDVDTTTQAGTQVGGAGQDVAEMLVPHEAVIVLLENLLNLADKKKGESGGTSRDNPNSFHSLMSRFNMYLQQTSAETLEDLPHVSALLHGDDTQVILLVHPDQEGLVVVVPART